MLDKFQHDLSALNSLQMVRKYFLSGHCEMLSDSLHYELKEDICEHFKIDFVDVVVVGSGKLGFSIAPYKRYRAFNDESDFDIALVSPVLFQQVWRETYEYDQSRPDWEDSALFFRYLSKGWIRPDKLPQSEYFQFTGYWWDFFNKLTSSGKYGPYKIRAGLYQSWFFLKEYQKICIEQCKEDI